MPCFLLQSLSLLSKLTHQGDVTLALSGEVFLLISESIVLQKKQIHPHYVMLFLTKKMIKMIKYRTERKQSQVMSLCDTSYMQEAG